MTEKEMLELEKYWCENCCNFDKGHIQMDGSAKCKLTGTMVYCEESGKECKCFNVPAENVIVPPCKVGDTVYIVDETSNEETGIDEVKVTEICYNGVFVYFDIDKDTYKYSVGQIGKTVFLTKEEAEKALKGCGKE